MTFKWLETSCLKQTKYASITVPSQAGSCCVTRPDLELNYAVFSCSISHDEKFKKSATCEAESFQYYQNNCAFISPVICGNSKENTTATMQAGMHHE